MGTNSDYTFIGNCDNLDEAWDRAGGNEDVSHAEGYSGEIADCEQPLRYVRGPSERSISLDEWLEFHWDLMSKREAVACKHDGGILIAFNAPE